MASVNLSDFSFPESAEKVPRSAESIDVSDWEDDALIVSYEKAVGEKAVEEAIKKAALLEARKKEAATAKEKFPVNSYCRALYSGDGCYYEGKVTIWKDFACMVEFVGYKNREEVECKNLKPSKGKKARRYQNKVAKETYNMNLVYAAEGQETNYVPPYNYDYPVAGAAENFNNSAAYYAPPEIPLPPEPPMPPCSVTNNPSLSALLMSWYMAGYYTGRYENQKGTSCSAKPCCHGYH